ncbi:MAG: ATPase [Okeania sp. SIO2F4]|uniref:NB-ARC domain-containing protein n=1 Tax=Okeania sp. SIO2F4 TaxID=2607790 RepID=UPI0014299453|nr:NB-ARC domain-containing protein [Okeania sp. SIO2F4]NES07114.1 ATPase [Okeania sp. SIO2F4]
MNVEEVLKLADELVFVKTGKHLNSLQQDILKGVWNSQKYAEIANNCNCTETHVKKVASDLWKTLSETLGERLNKSNLKATLERSQFANVSSYFLQDSVHIGNVNLCTDNVHSPTVSPPPQPQQTSTQKTTKPPIRIDLTNAPEAKSFYDRYTELNILEKYILEDKCRLLAVLGISGIGKTALSIHLLANIKHKFQYIIWRSLSTSPSLQTTLKYLIKFLSNQPETELPTTNDDRLSLLLEYLQKYRCLIVLDDLQMILNGGKLAGNYQPEYEDYSLLFKLVGELSHKSCLILNSWEPPLEISSLAGENLPVRCFKLNGLGKAGFEIFRENGLLDEDKWSVLINNYGGNPLWLKIVSRMISSLFNGRVAEYLKYDCLFLSEDLTSGLRQQFQRLSDFEKQVIFQICNESEPVSMFNLVENMEISISDILAAIQSLERRSLIEKIENSSDALFTIQPLLKLYLQTNTQNQKPITQRK